MAFDNPQLHEQISDLRIQRDQMVEAKRKAAAFAEACLACGVKQTWGGGIEINFTRLIAALGPEQTAELAAALRETESGGASSHEK